MQFILFIGSNYMALGGCRVAKGGLDMNYHEQILLYFDNSWRMIALIYV